MLQYNYAECDRPDCEYCALVKQANPGAVAPLPAATQKDLKTGLDDLESKMQTAALQEIGERADGDYNVAKNLGARVDAAVSGMVHGVSVDGIANDKKATDTDGVVYIVSATPTAGGAFAGHANQVASLQSGVWHFQAPGANETHLNESDNAMWTWNGTTWVKVGTVGNSAKLNDEIHQATEKLTTTRPAVEDNDEFAITDATETPAYALKKLTWGNLKAAMFTAGGTFADGISIRDNSTFQIWGSSDIWKVSWKQITDNLAKVFPKFADPHTAPVIGNLLRYTSTGWSAVSEIEVAKQVFPDLVKNLTAGTDLSAGDMIPMRGTDGVGYHLTGTTLINTLKNKLSTIYRKRQEARNGDENGMFVDIADFSGDPKIIRYKGFITAQGSGDARPSLNLRIANGEINMETTFTSRKITSIWEDGGAHHTSGYANGYDHRMYLIDPVDAGYAVKGNQNAFFDIEIYRYTGNWTAIQWTVAYQARGDQMIQVTGFAGGQLSAAKISGIHVKFDTQGTQAYRSMFGEVDVTVE